VCGGMLWDSKGASVAGKGHARSRLVYMIERKRLRY